ncbi:MAG: hypothetical protein AAGD35_01470 [Actinomycetota bacterium]
MFAVAPILAQTTEAQQTERMLTALIFLLLVVAALLTVITIWYWRHTSPRRVARPMGRSAVPLDLDEPDPNYPDAYRAEAYGQPQGYGQPVGQGYGQPVGGGMPPQQGYGQPPQQVRPPQGYGRPVGGGVPPQQGGFQPVFPDAAPTIVQPQTPAQGRPPQQRDW